MKFVNNNKNWTNSISDVYGQALIHWGPIASWSRIFLSVLRGSNSNMLSVKFLSVVQEMDVYGEELLLPGPTPKREDHSLSAVRDC